MALRPSLADRLRQIVEPTSRPAASPDAPVTDLPGVDAPEAPASPPREAEFQRAAAMLGGQWLTRAEGAVILVERFYPADARYGRFTIGDIVDWLVRGRQALDLLGRAWPSASGFGGEAHEGRAPSLMFLDLETTGLAGGAGTHAFLVGCAHVESGGLRVRQWLLPGLEHEIALLAEVTGWAAEPEGLVTFNGRSFDVPLIETRFLYHRRPFPLGGLPHLDMLHPARRLWKVRPSVVGPPLDDDSCKLSVLERHLAAVHRVGDVGGFEIPSRFFRFIRDGDAQPLEAVLEHNRLDLVSLALVTAHAISLIERGPAATTQTHECLGLGRVYERAGRWDEAEACYHHAVTTARRIGCDRLVHAEGLLHLARCRRRTGRASDAAAVWHELMDLPGAPAAWREEATHALAVHHEHRSKDFERARRLVLDMLAVSRAERRRADAHHRLARLERKLETRGGLIAVMEG